MFIHIHSITHANTFDSVNDQFVNVHMAEHKCKSKRGVNAMMVLTMTTGVAMATEVVPLLPAEFLRNNIEWLNEVF